MKILLLVALLLASCSTPKAVVEQQRREVIRCDTVGASLAGDLHVKLNDVIILPADSSRARVTIKSVELKEQTRAEVIAETRRHLSSDSQTETTPQRQPAPFLLYLIIALLALLHLIRK